MTTARPWVLAVVLACGGLLGACGSLFDTTGYGRDPDTGTCPDPLPGGAAAGKECDKAEDCAAVCCECSNGERLPFAAVACVDGECVGPDEVCDLVEDNQPEACEPMVLGLQENGACPEDDLDGDDPGDECEVAADCEGTCCTCPDGTTSYEAASCNAMFECAEEAQACADALAANPDLCPAAP